MRPMNKSPFCENYVHHPSSLCLVFRLAVLKQFFKFAHETLDIPKLPVDRGETHISHLVDLAQTLHDQLADFLGGDLLFHTVAQSHLYLIDEVLQGSQWNRSFLTCREKTSQDFLAIECLTSAVLFDDDERKGLDPLIGSKPAVTARTSSSAPNDATFGCRTRIKDATVRLSAVRTSHNVTHYTIYSRQKNTNTTYGRGYTSAPGISNLSG